MPTTITPERLTTLFRPRTVALVGASNKSVFSATAYQNLVRFGFSERTYLVNKRGTETHGQRTFTTCGEIPVPVDLAYLMVPQAGTLDALTDAHSAGVRNAVILSAGYGEAGASGRRAEADLMAHAQSLDMIVLGPNMLGFANFVDGVAPTSIPVSPHAGGSIGLLSQSGASSAAMADFAAMIGADLSYMVTLGNEAMITAGHVLDFLVEDDSTKAIAIFMETIRDPETFRRAALNAAAKGKAIVVLKAGSSELSARTAAAHTGALVGDDRVIDAVFRELGIIRVDSIEDMLITANTAAVIGRLDRPGIGIASISGGACDIIADRAQDFGAELPNLAPQTRSTMEEFFSSYGTIQNPLDVTGAAVIDTSIFTKSIEALSKDPSIGVVAVVSSIPWEDDGPFMGINIVNAIGEGIAKAKVPTVFVNQVLQPNSDYTKKIMAEAGVPLVVPGLRSAVLALKKISDWSERLRAITEASAHIPAEFTLPPSDVRRGRWSESTARDLLADAGIPVVPATLATTADQAVDAAAEFDCPVVLKIVSPDILHKSDIGGVHLNVIGEEAIRESFASVLASAAKVRGAHIEGVLVSPMRSSATELLLGVVHDPQWGPILAVGLGGIFVEVLADSALTALPVSPNRAKTLLNQLRGAAVLDGVRGGAAADRDRLAEVISRVGDLAVALGPDLASLEINPLHIDGSRIEALDAVVEWKDQS
ncbi:acetate--CoA ligase family protein [Rhodococcus erythropolis]|uniref:acetate--CoA ligase family protein n=1 Tax=Rhodococcus erythropolis TaxID=1833 RepID=UPI0022266885|nr:acetate--CoA ligase family protein [Rhodococcus erythropolis]MCW2295472.1 acyl-CoA synthetase (NDP forming) [Rhodococcus erythropolis]